MKTLEAGSADAVVTDPPYFKVKDEEWDRQWESEASFLEWIGELCAEWYRLLKPNGSLFVFASPQMSARVELKVAETFNVLNRITWRKHDGTDNKGGLWSRANKDIFRSFFPASESIIFAENYGADNMAKGEAGYVAKCDKLRGFVFEPLRAYLAGEWERAGLKQEDANKACGTASMAGRHFFSRSQWCLPTEQHYEALRKYANAQGGEFLRREYEELRREYEELRRPFNVTPDVPYTDIWDFRTVAAYPGKHPCEKPVALMQHIVTTSTLPGGVILDCFMGSGSTGVACARSGREFIGIEKDKEWFLKAQERLKRESGQGNLFDEEESA